MPATKADMIKVMELMGEFIAKHKGSWDHADWEKFLKKMSKNGHEPSPEVERALGSVMENAKDLYMVLPRRKKSSSTKAKGKKKTSPAEKAQPGVTPPPPD